MEWELGSRKTLFSGIFVHILSREDILESCYLHAPPFLPFPILRIYFLRLIGGSLSQFEGHASVVPPGTLLFQFILPRSHVQATLKPVQLPTTFPQPESLPYLKPSSPGEKSVWQDEAFLDPWEPKSTGL